MNVRQWLQRGLVMVLVGILFPSGAVLAAANRPPTRPADQTGVARQSMSDRRPAANEQSQQPQLGTQKKRTPSSSQPSSRRQVRFRIRIVHPRHRRLSAAEVQTDLAQLRRRSRFLINQERLNHDLSPLGRSAKLDRLAAVRARQVEHRFSHYDRQGYAMTTDDAQAVGLPHGFQGSENIASTSLGRCMSIGDPVVYHNRDGNDMAHMTNDAMMNHDQLEANGHRKNILSHASTLVGVGAAYSPRKHEFYVAEDFGDHDADSSQDVNHVSTAKKYQSAERSAWQQSWRHVRRVIGWCYRQFCRWL